MAGFDTLISVTDLQRRLGADGWRVVDCRFDLMQPAKGREEYRDGHIPGAVFADLDLDLAAPVTPDSGRHPLPDVGEFASRLGDWGIDNETQVVAYDYASGALAARLWWMMRWLGHRRVAVLDGGINAWTTAGAELSRRAESPPQKRFQPAPDDDMVISTEELLESLASPTPIGLVDARDEPRFRGEREPIDAVAGHVPGAVNFPFGKSLEADGHFLPPAALRESWTAVLQDPARPWAAMCGSGVTACHLALSAAIAGNPAPRLYVGSWSEWIRDPARPVAGAVGGTAGAADPR